MATTIALSDERHWLLSRLKEASGARSFDEAIALLLEGGPYSVWHLMMERGDQVRATCRRLGIRSLIAFGSRVRGAAHARSDLDLVARFTKRSGLFDLMAAQEELSQAFGVEVDLHTWEALKPRVRRRIDEEGVEVLA